jgi:hypothetical protein
MFVVARNSLFRLSFVVQQEMVRKSMPREVKNVKGGSGQHLPKPFAGSSM